MTRLPGATASSPRRRAVRVVGALLALSCGVVSCLGGRLKPSDLPEEPIAVLHWAERSGQKRAEIFEKIGEAPPLPADDTDQARLDEAQIRAYLRADEILQIRPQTAKHPGRLMLLHPRTAVLEEVEEAPLDAIPLDWSPDRQRLLIASRHRGGREQLYEVHFDRRDLSPVTFGPAEHPRGTYAPDGSIYVQRIERVRPVGASANTLHRVESGGRLGPVLAERVPPGRFQVVPAERLAVYEQVVPRPRRNGPTVFESFVASVALRPGAEERLLTKGREPVLTPDGRQIVFASPSSAGYRLRRMRLDGTSRVPIGPGGTGERMPSVSPDGAFVAFVQADFGRRRIAVRRFDGKDERVLLSSGWTEFPVW